MNKAIIPKTSNKQNVAINYALWDQTLSADDMKLLNSLNKMKKFCWNPNQVV